MTAMEWLQKKCDEIYRKSDGNEWVDFFGWFGWKDWPITDIKVCKLPYQEHPFVHGRRNGEDVWLTADGNWTTIEDHELAAIPLNDGLEIKHPPETVEDGYNELGYDPELYRIDEDGYAWPR